MALQAAYYYVQLAVLHATSREALLLGSVRGTTTESTNRKNLPPSPPGKLPIIGHLHLIGSMLNVTFRDLAAKYGDDGMLLLHLGAVPTLIVSLPRAAEAVLRTHDQVFASRSPSTTSDIILYGSSDITFAPYGEYWRQVRLVIDKIREAAGTAVDMSELLVGYTNDNVCRAVFGEFHREKGRSRLFRELTEINVALLGGFNLEDCFPRLAKVGVLRRMVCAKAKRLRQRWDDLFDELIDEHAHSSKPSAETEENSEDFIHVLLSLQEEYGLITENIKAILIHMFEAGIETSYLILEYAMDELMNNTHAMTKLRNEVRMCTPSYGKWLNIIPEEYIASMAYLKATIKETFRLHPPAPLLIPHFSEADCQINGYLIPAGTRALINAWALGRDPTSWEKQEEFLPERFLQDGSSADIDMKGKDIQFVPFGSGRRICPGSNFGVATIEIMLANLIYHFDWEVPNEIKGSSSRVDMSETFGLTLRRKEKLYLVPKIP